MKKRVARSQRSTTWAINPCEKENWTLWKNDCLAWIKEIGEKTESQTSDQAEHNRIPAKSLSFCQTSHRDAKPPKNAKKKYMIPTDKPTQKLTQHHVLAVLDAAIASEVNPALSLPFTCAAYTIATIPNGRQQKIVIRMA